MTDITTKFDDFKNKKIDKFEKDKEFQHLSDDIIALKEFGDGSFEKIKGIEKIPGTIKIISITEIIKDPEKIKRLEEVSENPVISTDLNLEEVKRDDTIWIVAFIQKPVAQSSLKAQTFQAILKCKIADFGLLLVK